MQNLAGIIGGRLNDLTPRDSNTDIEVLREVKQNGMALVPYDPQDYRR